MTTKYKGPRYTVEVDAGAGVAWVLDRARGEAPIARCEDVLGDDCPHPRFAATEAKKIVRAMNAHHKARWNARGAARAR